MSFIKGDPNKNLIPVFEVDTPKGVIVQAGPGIIVTDLSDAENYRFEVEAEIQVALIATLGLTAKAAGVIKSNPVLKGTIIDRLEFTMAYNKTITSQTLTNTGALTPPTLSPSATTHLYTAQSVVADITFTLTGNDGEGQPTSIDTDTKSVLFGNYMSIGKGTTRIGTATSGMSAFIAGLASHTIKSSRSHTYYATGDENEKSFVAYPKSFGLATFTKGIFTGGYVRLKNVAGTIVTDGSPETDIMITNAAGYEEAYYVYESLYDNQNDPVTPFIIS